MAVAIGRHRTVIRLYPGLVRPGAVSPPTTFLTLQTGRWPPCDEPSAKLR